MLNIFGGRINRELSELEKPKKIEIPAVNRREWSQSLKDSEPPELKIHVYNFLITEGHFDIAETFAKESGLPSRVISMYEKDPRTNQGVTARRLEIKMLVKNDKIDEAIERLSSFEME